METGVVSVGKIAEGLLWYAAFLFSTTLHEASHAFAAHRLGDSTAYEAGQVTLNPIPHIRREPFGTVAVPLISFFLGGWMIGWASTPYDPRWAYDNPRASAKMSAAGPAANALLALLAALAVRVGILAGVFVTSESISYGHIIDGAAGGALSTLASFVSVFFSLNLLLLAFNLLPVPPLDGSGIIQFFLSRSWGQKYFLLTHNGAFAFIGIVIAWRIFDVVYAPLHLFVINLLFFPIASYG
jgi:Zn-dependent protease